MIGRNDGDQLLHQIMADRRAEGAAARCLKVLDDADALASHFIRKTSAVATRRRYREIRKYLSELSEDVGRDMADKSDAAGFVEWELAEQRKLWDKFLGGSSVSMKYPTVEAAVSAAEFVQYTATSNYENYLNGIAANYFGVWDANVRAGYLAGIPTAQIVRKVVGEAASGGKVADAGAMQVLRRSVERNTRTALQAMACETRRQIYERNAGIFSGYKWLATLDRRTCAECGRLDGRVERRLSDFGSPPLHYNCRCIIVPQVEGYEDLDPGERASEGGAAKAETYEEWVETLEAETRREYGI